MGAPTAIGEREVLGRTWGFTARPVQPPEVGTDPGPTAMTGLGLAALAFGVVMAGWLPAATTPGILAFALITGGFVPLIAGAWALRQRSTVEATAYCTVGGFWLSYFLLHSLILSQIPTLANARSGFEGFFLMVFGIALCYVGLASARSWLVAGGAIVLLGLGLIGTAIGLWAVSDGWLHTGGWVAFVAGILALLAAAASLGIQALPMRSAAGAGRWRVR